MKPIEIKKSILSLNKKAIANLSDTEMNVIHGGVVTKPTATSILVTAVGCPCTHFCDTNTK